MNEGNHMRIRDLFGAARRTGRKQLAATASIAMMAATAALVPAAAAGASTATIYDATPTPLPPNVVSLGFEATSTSEFGDLVTLAGTDRALEEVTVTMSDWALFSDYSTDVRYMGDSVNWTHPITLTVYDSALTPLASTTQTVTIPWRPVADPTCSTPTAWRAGDGNCYNGKAFNATFDLSSPAVTLPNDVIVGVAFDTQHYGAAPIGSAGPYNSLNVGVPSGQTASVGTDQNADNVYWNTSQAGFYADGGTAGVGIFREDTGWTPNGTVAFKITSSHVDTLGPCPVSIAGSNPTVYTLLADCTTDHTVVVPQNPGGSTFDGDGHTITGVDPVAGHFTGAVVQAQAGPNAITVKNLTVTVSNLADVCDGDANRLRGILFDNVAGAITNNEVIGLKQGTNSGCQEGNGIDVRNAPFDTTGTDRSVLMTGNVVTDYQKTGIVASGSVAVTLRSNTVTGAGPITYIAQNGIQVGFGATAIVKSNSSSRNTYTPKSFVACGLLVFQADGVSASGNNFFDNERNQCNFGKGGGTFKPSTP
jgi:hypothetical protein